MLSSSPRCVRAPTAVTASALLNSRCATPFAFAPCGRRRVATSAGAAAGLGASRRCAFAAGVQVPARVHLTQRARTAEFAGAVAMANPRRSQRVSQQIMREVSTLILSDKRARSIMSPEHRLGADGSISTVTSITEVVISGDLQVAKIYVSFFGDQRGADAAFAGLQRLEPYLRSQVGKAMQMRHVPELRFFRDEGAERGGRVMSLLADLRSAATTDAAAALASPAPVPRTRGSDSGTDSDVDDPLQPFEYDSADDDIILVDDRT